MKKYVYKYSVRIVESDDNKLTRNEELIYFKTYKKAYNYLKKTADKYNVNIQFVNNRKFEDKIIDLYLSDVLIYVNNNQRYHLNLYLFKERYNYNIIKYNK